jgi:5-formyltetrahydrofolate cyclo-ligase
MNQPDLKQTRATIRRQRREISNEVRKTATARIVNSMAKLKSFQRSRRIAGFVAFDGEADPLALMTLAHQQQKQVYVPIMIAKREPLKFCPWQPDTPKKLNHFGIEEPDVDSALWITSDQLDFVICPLVAFDQRCQRIGVGAGYYDRSFVFLNDFDQNHPRHVERPTVLAGFAFEMQKVTEIQPQPWDVALDWVVTERQLDRRFR